MTPEELLAEIANEIEAKGHYQGPTEELLRHDERGVCLVTSQTFSDMSVQELREAWLLLSERTNAASLVKWNDNTPTAEVLAVLRGQTVPKEDS